MPANHAQLLLAEGSSLGREWTLANSWTWSTNVANVDFTGLGSFGEIRVRLDAVTSSGAGIRQVQVSDDNGLTFYSTTSDYRSVDATGVEAGVATINAHLTGSASARSGEVWISVCHLTGRKVALCETILTAPFVVLPTTTSVINAVRVKDSVGNLSGGSVEIWVR
jgi:hypothetical protein